MAKRSDPTLPYTEIEIAGSKYKMCFDLGALAEAEDLLLAKGHEVNLLIRLPRLNLSNTRVLFAASLMAYHPELDFEETKTWLNRDNAFEIAGSMMAAWKKNTPDPDGKDDPPEPDQ